MRLLRVTAALALLAPCLARAQAPIGSMLRIEVESDTLYIADCPNAQLGKTANKLDRPLGQAVESGFGISDLVSVNGTPMKGAVYQSVIAGLSASPNPAPGHPIVDSPRQAVMHWDLDLVGPDGAQIGTVQISGLGGGARPPGAPREIAAYAYTVTGGTGAFFGVRGYFQPVTVLPQRVTSACEDSALRRVNAEGRGKRQLRLYLVPPARPEILMASNGPAVVHANDFTPVSAAKPARAGETLTLFASGLGPTRPGVNPGEPFTADPLQVVNSPVQVLVSGKPGEVLYAGGYPGAVNAYQVNFRVPDGTAAGPAPVQLTCAWIAGPEVRILIQ